MKFKLIIDKEADEEIVAVVHSASPLTEQIENLVRDYSGKDCIIGYKNEEMRKIPFSEIECITVIDRKVIIHDCDGENYRIQERLRDLDDILPSCFMRINKSTIANEHKQDRHHAKRRAE